MKTFASRPFCLWVLIWVVVVTLMDAALLVQAQEEGEETPTTVVADDGCTCEQLASLEAEKSALAKELEESKAEVATLTGNKRVSDRYVERLELDMNKFKQLSEKGEQEVVLLKARYTEELEGKDQLIKVLQTQLSSVQSQVDELSSRSFVKQLQTEVTDLWSHITDGVKKTLNKSKGDKEL